MTTMDQLTELSIAELRALAASAGIPSYGTMARGRLLSELVGIPQPGNPLDHGAQALGASSIVSAPPAPRAEHQGADPGLPIPDSYGTDRLVLLVQDPHHVFAYWELAGGAYERARAACGDGHTPVLVLRAPHGEEQREVDLLGGNYYLAAAPQNTYQARLALRGRDGRLHVMVESNSVTTPAAAVSSRLDEDWMAVDETMDGMLEGGLLLGSSAGSGNRFLNARRLHLQRIGLSTGAPDYAWQESLHDTQALPSSMSVPTVESLSSHSLLPSSHQHGGLPSSHETQSSHLLSSHLLSSRALSSRAVGSGGQLGHGQDLGAEPEPYPVAGTFQVTPTGLPKAAEGVPTPGPAPASAPAPAASATPPAAPKDPLAFIGAPKPDAATRPAPPAR